MFTQEQIKKAVIDAVAEAYGVDASTLTMQTNYTTDLKTSSVKVMKMILFTNENLDFEDDEGIEFEDVQKCQVLQDTIDVLTEKYGVAT